jgi:hypothetical protein
MTCALIVALAAAGGALAFGQEPAEAALHEAIEARLEAEAETAEALEEAAEDLREAAEDLLREADELQEQEGIRPEHAEAMRREARELMHRAEALRREPYARHRPYIKLPGMLPWGSRADTVNAIVVPSGPLDDADVDAIADDLAIMSRIFGKALRQEFGEGYEPPPEHAIMAPLFAGHGPRAVFLQGHGAVFILNVKFPLAGPQEQERPEAEEEPDSIWEDTRREMKEPPGFPFAAEPPHRPPRGGPEFDPEKVERLTAVLLETVRHAANMHGLEPGHSIAVAVTGTAPVTPPDYAWRSEVRADVGRTVVISGRLGGQRPAVLTIHVRKADVDAFATGESDSEQFRQGAVIALH